jgi:succinoglycan biosynthesis protein ExoA
VHLVMSVLALLLATWLPLLLLWPLAYALVLMATSVWVAWRHASWCGLLAGAAAAVMHISWAAGFLSGLAFVRESAWRAGGAMPAGAEPTR